MFHVNTTSVDELIQILKGKKLPTGHVSTRKDGSQWRKKDDKKGGKGNWVMVKGPTKAKKTTDPKPKKARSENPNVESKPKKAEKNPKKIAKIIAEVTPETRRQATEALYGTGTFKTKAEARNAMVQKSLEIALKPEPQFVELETTGLAGRSQNDPPVKALDVRSMTREPIFYKKDDKIDPSKPPEWMSQSGILTNLSTYYGRIPCVPYKDKKGISCYVAKTGNGLLLLNAAQIHSAESFYKEAERREYEINQNRKWMKSYHDMLFSINGETKLLKQDAIEPYITRQYNSAKGFSEEVTKQRINWNKFSEEDWKAEEKYLESQLKTSKTAQDFYKEIQKSKWNKIRSPKKLGANRMLTAESNLMFSFSKELEAYGGLSRDQKKWEYYRKFREEMGYSLNDLKSVGEDLEFESTYDKGRETSYGDSGTTPALLKKYGIQTKMQNGDVVTPAKLKEVEEVVKDVYSVFGDRSSMAKEWGLKVSHAGNKNMHASKFVGLFVPSQRAIGVSWSNSPGFTFAHEFGHFIDHYLGKQLGYHFITSGHGLESEIAKTFREGMDKKEQKIGYWTRSTECFARALEQYYGHKKNKPYKDYSGKNPPEAYFKQTIVPMIDEFFRTRNDVLKSAFNILMGISR